MIPKIIHYCWLSEEPVPSKLQRYIKGWKEKLPDYELMLWDFDRFDIHSSLWVKQAFEAKKYAFAADYIRLYALYHYGGIYLDSDVEVIKTFDDLLERDFILGYDPTDLDISLFENIPQKSYSACLPFHIEAAIMGAVPKASWVGRALKYYDGRSFNPQQRRCLRPLPSIISEVLNIEFDDVQWKLVLPKDYLSPKEFKDGKIYSTSHTYCVHHFAGSWIPAREKRYKKLKQVFTFLLGRRLVAYGAKQSVIKKILRFYKHMDYK